MTHGEYLVERLKAARRSRRVVLPPMVFWACLMFPLIIAGIVGFVLGRLT